jgi:hypothetical protein
VVGYHPKYYAGGEISLVSELTLEEVSSVLDVAGCSGVAFARCDVCAHVAALALLYVCTTASHAASLFFLP